MSDHLSTSAAEVVQIARDQDFVERMVRMLSDFAFAKLERASDVAAEDNYRDMWRATEAALAMLVPSHEVSEGVLDSVRDLLEEKS